VARQCYDWVAINTSYDSLTAISNTVVQMIVYEFDEEDLDCHCGLYLSWCQVHDYLTRVGSCSIYQSDGTICQEFYISCNEIFALGIINDML
jgi:hypothetical protein